MTTLYGIKNCDTVKKARKWMEANGHEYAFHDFRADGINADQITTWIEAVGPELLVNRRSTTWKQLTDEQKSYVLDNNQPAIIELLIEQPTLIKRPVLEYKNNVKVGFKADDYTATLG